jgi:hypothetical protein
MTMVGKLAVVTAACSPSAMRWCPSTTRSANDRHQHPVAGSAGARQRLWPAAARQGRPTPRSTPAAPSRWSSTPTRAGPGSSSRRSARAGAPGRAHHGDVRVPERAEPPHGGAGHPSYAPNAGGGAFQQAGVLLLQPVHAGARREETVAGGLSSSTPSCPRTSPPSRCRTPSLKWVAKRPGAAAATARRRAAHDRRRACARERRRTMNGARRASSFLRTVKMVAGLSSGCASAANTSRTWRRSTRCTSSGGHSSPRCVAVVGLIALVNWGGVSRARRTGFKRKSESRVRS